MLLTHLSNKVLWKQLLFLSDACKQLSWGSIRFGKCPHLSHKQEYNLYDTVVGGKKVEREERSVVQPPVNSYWMEALKMQSESSILWLPASSQRPTPFSCKNKPQQPKAAATTTQQCTSYWWFQIPMLKEPNLIWDQHILTAGCILNARGLKQNAVIYINISRLLSFW